MGDEWKPCFFCKTTKTPERIGKIPVCGNCLAEIYEKGKLAGQAAKRAGPAPSKYRENLEKRVRKAMAENPGISLKGLREKLGGGNGTLSTIYHRVLKETSKNRGTE